MKWNSNLIHLKSFKTSKKDSGKSMKDFMDASSSSPEKLASGLTQTFWTLCLRWHQEIRGKPLKWKTFSLLLTSRRTWAAPDPQCPAEDRPSCSFLAKRSSKWMSTATSLKRISVNFLCRAQRRAKTPRRGPRPQSYGAKSSMDVLALRASHLQEEQHQLGEALGGEPLLSKELNELNIIKSYRG